MPWQRTIGALIGMVLAFAVCGQAVLHKHLIVSLGGGGGILAIESNADSLNADGLPSSAVRFSFAYALGDRFSLGGHYDRIGTVRHEGGVDRLRFTTYMIEGSYRPINAQRSVIEVTAAAGLNIMALRPIGHLIPYDSAGPTFAFGLRYLRLINETIGLQVAVDHAQGLTQQVNFHEEPLQVTPDDPLTIGWHGQRITGGMFIRF